MRSSSDKVQGSALTQRSASKNTADWQAAPAVSTASRGVEVDHMIDRVLREESSKWIFQL